MHPTASGSTCPTTTAIVLKRLAVDVNTDDSHALVPRAARYTIEIPMRYRPAGESQWREAKTENISRSGVLFRTSHIEPLQVSIEMLLALPVEVGGGENAM